MNLINEQLKEACRDIVIKQEQFLVKACEKHGLILNEASAPDFQIVSVINGSNTLVHVPTGKAICCWNPNPEITMLDNSVRVEMIFKEL